MVWLGRNVSQKTEKSVSEGIEELYHGCRKLGVGAGLTLLRTCLLSFCLGTLLLPQADRGWSEMEEEDSLISRGSWLWDCCWSKGLLLWVRIWPRGITGTWKMLLFSMSLDYVDIT